MTPVRAVIVRAARDRHDQERAPVPSSHAEARLPGWLAGHAGKEGGRILSADVLGDELPIGVNADHFMPRELLTADRISRPHALLRGRVLE